MNKEEIKVTSNYSEFGSKSDGETNLMKKEKKNKSRKVKIKLKNQMKYNVDIPKFCSQCGGRMILGKKKVNRYDEETGKIESYQYTAKCEKICGWRIILGYFQFHDDFLVIDSPYSCITEKPHRTILEKSF